MNKTELQLSKLTVSTCRFVDFQRNLQQAESIVDLNLVLKNYLREFSIQTFAFTYYAHYSNSNNQLKYDFTSDNFKRWHEYYHEQNYGEVDSTMDEVNKTVLPTAWNLHEQLQTARTDRERRMRLDSIEFGAEQGLCIPIYGPKNEFAVLLLVQMQGESWMENWPTAQAQLFTAGYYYFAYLQKQLLINLDNNHPEFILNKRELQCLQLIAKEFSVTQIAKTLLITERTVNFHIQKLNKKLGAKNKYESLIKALQQGLITP